MTNKKLFWHGGPSGRQRGALVLLVMFEVATFPSAHHWMGYVVLGYLFLILACLTGEILRDVWRWWQGGEE